MLYDNISNVRKDPDMPFYLPSWMGGGLWYNLPAPQPPTSERRALPDSPKIEKSKTQKVKGSKPWKQVLKDGDIKMTPYFNKEITTEFHVFTVPRWLTTFGVHAHAKNECPKVYGPYIDGKYLSTHFDQTYDFRDFTDLYQYNSSYDIDSEVASAINEVQSEVISNQFSGYDLLTELGELPETLETIVSLIKALRHPITGIKELIQKYKKLHNRGGRNTVIDKAHKDIMDQWMQYRYALMPIYYSIMDVVKLLQELQFKYKTDRALRVLQFPDVPTLPLVENFTYRKITGVVKVRAVGKSHYEDPSLRLNDLLTVNPFLTAWELIPMSFVVDWFVNIGDWLFANTAGLRDFASQRSFCYSVKKDYKDELFVSFSVENGMKHVGTGNKIAVWGTCNNHEIFTWDDWSFNTYSKDRYNDQLLTSLTVKSYERELFVPSDIDLDFDPSLNWKRFLDAYVLSMKPALKALKSN